MLDAVHRTGLWCQGRSQCNGTHLLEVSQGRRERSSCDELGVLASSHFDKCLDVLVRQGVERETLFIEPTTKMCTDAQQIRRR